MVHSYQFKSSHHDYRCTINCVYADHNKKKNLPYFLQLLKISASIPDKINVNFIFIQLFS